ncbi:hypothetical protein HCN51_19485 [Nonomuraea sp. FMUSA5-5]|uniref:Uncharacterized protein n=1 Tax=Nonomuraea composti TaxID=2720023 RepID=A0ABX1B1A4_9ACTN|nr:hypothetical protein [Nonomuraea sp. FMUSA5-5]NJP91615.1 hypothetical protein [Nonomuraea sp. FMUSA5-5]
MIQSRNTDREENTPMAVLDGIALPPRWRITSRLLAGWPIDDDHLLELWPHGRTEDGRIRWLYRLSRGNQTIFSATDISSPTGTKLSTDTLISTARTVLSFLTLREGDTDAEFFDHYTRTQRKWRESYAEELSLYALYGVCGYCGEEHPSPGCGSVR